MRRRVKRGEDGISLIEMVVAVLVLSIGIVAGYQSLGQSRLAIGGALPRVLAQEAALNRAEELRLIGMAAGRSLPEIVRQGPYDWRITVDEAPTQGGFVEARVRAGAPDLPGAVFVVYVPPGAPQ
ncbi:MAG: prepilin-type N-terminal cleavage/methylation domain-containing protein [Rhodobacter sp.]|nr:prepilin-type N-terminal cleavage/methylation domain-containing protein [Rhodobacter sp.]